MMNKHKIFLSVLGLAAAGCLSSGSVQAAGNDAVLLKVHDVQPIKGTDNLTTSCDYNVTVYNRSSKDLTSASLLLTWTDTTMDSFIQGEKDANARSGKSGFNQDIANMEANTPVQISSMIDVPTLAPQKQVSLRARIQSDRCFLLTGPLTIQVKSCKLGEGETTGRSRSFSSNDACDGLFQYVSPESAEYYREFKPISYDDMQIQGEARRAKDRTEINTQYDTVVTEISKVSTVLKDIKGNVTPDVAKKKKTPASAANNNLSDKLQSLFPDSGNAAATAPAAPAASGEPVPLMPAEASADDKSA